VPTKSELEARIRTLQDSLVRERERIAELEMALRAVLPLAKTATEFLDDRDTGVTSVELAADTLCSTGCADCGELSEAKRRVAELERRCRDGDKSGG